MQYLIVESINDQYFVEALLEDLNAQETRVRYVVDDFAHSPDGKDVAVLGNILTGLDGSGAKIGIIKDLDRNTISQRLGFIQEVIEKSLQENGFNSDNVPTIEEQGRFYSYQISDYLTVEFACYFTNINERGELEDVLKAIATQDTTFADCLEDGWKACFEAKGKQLVESGQPGGDITSKELIKLWVDFYKRYDTLKRGNRDSDTTSWKEIWTGPDKRGSHIFNLRHPALNDLRAFLRLFVDAN